MWEDLAPAPKAEKNKAPVRVGMIKVRDTRARLAIVMQAAPLALLGKVGRYKISIGTGQNGHQLRIMPMAASEVGGFEPSEFGKAKGNIHYRFLLPPINHLPDEKRPYQACSFAHEKAALGALLIDIPSYAWRKAGK